MADREIITAEFHCHTVYSRDSSNRISRLLQTARERGLDRLAVTDHNTIRGALKARELDPGLVVVGEEIMTSRGEILGYYLEEEIPPGLPPMEVITQLKAQNAFIALPHPMDVLRHGWRQEDLQALLPHVDALETFNARSLSRQYNRRAKELAEEKGISQIAGSDAHSLVEVGMAVVRLPAFRSADELREAVRSGKIQGKMLSPLDHFKASLLIGLGRLNPFRKMLE